MTIKNKPLSSRQQNIIEYLKVNNSATTDELVKLFNTSPITIRRDFKKLENAGLLLRYYGGAQLNKLSNDDTSTIIEKKKIAIAKHAASLVDDGDIIFINSSSTAILMLEFLENKRVVVVTNNGKALEKQFGLNVDLIITGGSVYGRKQSMTGDLALQTLSNITARKCFLGVSGIDANLGISTSVHQETSINKEMIRRTDGDVYVLSTSNKIGLHYNFSSGEISDINYLITDTDSDPNKIIALNQKNVTTVLVNCSDDIN